MNGSPLFSVLMANYNNGDFIAEAIDSVISQTYENWEIVVIDDASTDQSLSVLENYINKGTNVRLFKNERNFGCGYTKKRCVMEAKGSLCGFLDPDDTLATTAIEKTVKRHLSNKTLSIVYTYTMRCDQNLHEIGLFPWGGKLPANESQLTARAGQKIVHFAAFKKQLYLLTQGINPAYKRAVDQDLYYKLEEVGDIYCIEEPLYYYRQHKNNISLNDNNIKAWYWLYIVNKDAYNRRKKNTLSIKNITYGELQRTFLHVCLLKIDEKIRNGNYRNIFYYYCQVIRLCIWDREMEIFKKHVFFLKRAVIKNFLK